VVAVPLPLISAPGRHPQASGGRLENVIVEQLADTAGAKYIYWRAPGLKAFGTTANAVPRGQLAVGNTLYTVVGTKVYSSNSAGGAATALGGTLPGTTGVFMAANNAATPDIVIVAPGDGAFILSAGSVASYPDTDVGQPNSVVFHKGYFVFTYGDGKTRTSGINSTSINTTDVATAESKPDTLYRPIPLGNGQILLAGSSSIEVWGGQNDTGYPFSYIATIPRGIVGQYAIAGHEDGFGLGIFLVGDDYGVSTLNGYATVKISSPDVDRAIEGTADKTTIRVSVFIAGGHSYVVVQAPLWCWVYDVGVQTWHQRKSYSNTAIINYWRAAYPIKAFEKWLCTDLLTGNILQIDASTQDEVGNAASYEDRDRAARRVSVSDQGEYDRTLSNEGRRHRDRRRSRADQTGDRAFDLKERRAGLVKPARPCGWRPSPHGGSGKSASMGPCGCAGRSDAD
jgi:hypothetical protein